MRQYRVLVIQHCLKNNKIAKFGEIVDGSQLTSSAEDLERQGFIEEVKAEVPAEEDKKEPVDLEVKSEEVKAEVPAKKSQSKK